MRNTEEYSSITSKGQVTIPKKFRDKLNLKQGDRVKFIPKEIDGELCLTLSKASAFSILQKELQAEAEERELTREELEEWIDETREKLFKELHPDV